MEHFFLFLPCCPAPGAEFWLVLCIKPTIRNSGWNLATPSLAPLKHGEETICPMTGTVDGHSGAWPKCRWDGQCALCTYMPRSGSDRYTQPLSQIIPILSVI